MNITWGGATGQSRELARPIVGTYPVIKFCHLVVRHRDQAANRAWFSRGSCSIRHLKWPNAGCNVWYSIFSISRYTHRAQMAYFGNACTKKRLIICPKQQPEADRV